MTGRLDFRLPEHFMYNAIVTLDFPPVSLIGKPNSFKFSLLFDIDFNKIPFSVKLQLAIILLDEVLCFKE